MKLVQQKIQIPSLANLAERKFKNREIKHDNTTLNLLTQDRLGTSRLMVKGRGGGHG